MYMSDITIVLSCVYKNLSLDCRDYLANWKY